MGRMDAKVYLKLYCGRLPQAKRDWRDDLKFRQAIIFCLYSNGRYAGKILSMETTYPKRPAEKG